MRRDGKMLADEVAKMTAVFTADAVVTAQDGDNYRIYVSLLGMFGGQGPAIPVSPLLQGHCDAVRGDFPPLPAVGTHGLVLFSRGDLRNGRWVGGNFPALTDSSAHSASEPNMRYRAEFGGGWSLVDEGGQQFQQWPDGTSLTIGSGTAAPTRHTLGPNQVREATPFPLNQRVAAAVAPMPITLMHATGVQIVLGASGAVSVVGVAGQPVDLSCGGSSVVLDGSGNATVSGTVVTIADGGSALALLTSAWNAWLTTHTHPSNGAPPSQAAPAHPVTTVLKAQ